MEVRLSELVRTVRRNQRMSQREFAEALTERVRANLSHVSVGAWEKGKYEPETDFLLQVLVAYTDWRSQFALAALVAKVPEVFADGKFRYYQED